MRGFRRIGSIPQLAAAGILGVMLILCVVPQVVAPLDPLRTQPGRRLQWPSRAHLAGTDYLGRDIWSRVVYGARCSPVPAVLIAGAIGSSLGLAAGYAGGWTDESLMRLTDIFLAVPPLILAMAIATALGPSARNAAIAVIAVWWPSYARLARAEAQVLRTVEYVQAARAGGAGSLRVVLRHILP